MRSMVLPHLIFPDDTAGPALLSMNSPSSESLLWSLVQSPLQPGQVFDPFFGLSGLGVLAAANNSSTNPQSSALRAPSQASTASAPQRPGQNFEVDVFSGLPSPGGVAPANSSLNKPQSSALPVFSRSFTASTLQLSGQNFGNETILGGDVGANNPTASRIFSMPADALSSLPDLASESSGSLRNPSLLGYSSHARRSRSHLGRMQSPMFALRNQRNYQTVRPAPRSLGRPALSANASLEVPSEAPYSLHVSRPDSFDQTLPTPSNSGVQRQPMVTPMSSSSFHGNGRNGGAQAAGFRVIPDTSHLFQPVLEICRQFYQGRLDSPPVVLYEGAYYRIVGLAEIVAPQVAPGPAQTHFGTHPRSSRGGQTIESEPGVKAEPKAGAVDVGVDPKELIRCGVCHVDSHSLESLCGTTCAGETSHQTYSMCNDCLALFCGKRHVPLHHKKGFRCQMCRRVNEPIIGSVFPAHTRLSNVPIASGSSSSRLRQV